MAPVESDSATAAKGGAPPEVTLYVWLDETPRSWRAILDVFIDIGRALASAHAKGIAHQEIRIDNVMVAPGGRARLSDLQPKRNTLPAVGPGGLRTAAMSLEQRLAEMHSTDAAAYLAPEQFKGWVADSRTNQFNYCIAFYRALYRQAPFDHEWAASQMGETASRRTPLGSIHFDLVVRSLDRTSMIHLAREVLGGNIRPPPEDTDVPGWLEQIVRRGLQSDPDERFASMNDLLDAVSARVGKDARGRGLLRRIPVGTMVVVVGLALAIVLAVLSRVTGWFL